MILRRVDRLGELGRGAWCWMDGLVIVCCPSTRHPRWARPPVIALGTWRRALQLHLDGSFSIEELRCSCGWHGSVVHGEVCPAYDLDSCRSNAVRAA